MIFDRDPLAGLVALAPHAALKGLTPHQRDAIGGKAQFRTWMAGRRAGKSYAAACWLLGGGPGQFSAYCSRTLKSAKAILLGVFAELNSKYNLNLTIRASTGTIIEPNGHTIQFYGLRDVTQADLMRGQKFRRVFVDEGGAFDDDLLKYSIESVIQPTLLDLRGSLIVAGTPGPIPKGYFYEMTGNPGLEVPLAGRWETFHWSFRQNPTIDAEALIQECLTVNGWTPQSPTFRREFDAIWIEDTDAIIYKYAGEKWARVPTTHGQTVMAIDFGSGSGKKTDSTTWTVWRQPYDAMPHVFCLEAVARDEIELPEVARITRELREKWSVNKIVADEGALGKGLANVLRGTYRLPIVAAKKQNKKGRILSARGRLAAGTLHLCEGAKSLADEWLSLCWNDSKDDHHPRQADDLSDSALYGLEEFVAWQEERKPTPQEAEQDRIKHEAMIRAQRGPGFSGRGI